MSGIIQNNYSELCHIEASAKHWFNQYQHQLEQELQTNLSPLEEKYMNHKAQTTDTIKQSLQTELDRVQLAITSWDSAAWESYPTNKTPTAEISHLRVGSIRKTFSQLGINEVPILLPMLEQGHVLAISNKTGKAPAYTLLRNLVLRAILLLADQNTEFIFVDPLGMGANFPFQSLPTSLVGKNVFTEETEIDAQLQRLTHQIREGGSDKRLVLCVTDFPRRFNEDALQRILSIAQQGVSANVYVIMHVDSDIPLPDGYDPSPLIAASSVVFLTPEGIKARIGEDEYEFQPDSLPEQALTETLLQKISTSY